jgi:glycosyltransferase involved in cell wall biosynthesis
MNNHLISIIVPNYNHARFLNERMLSVLNQTYERNEIIILDDCSCDDSKVIIEGFKEVGKIAHIVYNESNSGSPFKQWVKGIEMAKGDLIWIAESDDLADARFLEKIIPYFDDPEVVVVFTDCKIINEASKVVYGNNTWIHDPLLDIGFQKKSWEGLDFIEQFNRYRNFISNASSVVFRKEAVDGTDLDKIQTFRYAGDWFFWNRLVLKGKVIFIPETLCNWRSHDASTRSIVDLTKDVDRLKEASRVIYETNKYMNVKPLMSNYDWIITWWLSRYSYANLWKFNYILPSLPFNRLYVRLYAKLVSRSFKEFFYSLKSIFS